MALITTYSQEAVFEATAFEIRFKLSMDMSRQTFTLKFQLLNQGRVVFLDKLVEQSLLWAMTFIGGVTKGMPINRGRLSFAWRQHAVSTPTELQSCRVEPCAMRGNIRSIQPLGYVRADLVTAPLTPVYESAPIVGCSLL